MSRERGHGAGLQANVVEHPPDVVLVGVGEEEAGDVGVAEAAQEMEETGAASAKAAGFVPSAGTPAADLELAEARPSPASPDNS